MELPGKSAESCKIGARVHVQSADGSQDLGCGTYMGERLISGLIDGPEDLAMSDAASSELPEADRAQVGAIFDHLLSEGTTTPEIALDSGETIYGFQCWWHEIDEAPSRQ